MEEIKDEYKNGIVVSHVYPEYPDGFYKAYLLTDKSNGGYKYTHFGTNVKGYIYLDSTMLTEEVRKCINDTLNMYRNLSPFSESFEILTNDEFKIQGDNFYLATDKLRACDIKEIERTLDIESKLIEK